MSASVRTHSAAAKPLHPEHVKVGTLIWYSGETLQYVWGCPAVIETVDSEKRRFQVRSLDDLVLQDQWYEFDIRDDSPKSRTTMRIADAEEVEEYLKGRRSGILESIAQKEQAVALARNVLRRHDDYVGTLFPKK